jgi:proline iminopeptidase
MVLAPVTLTRRADVEWLTRGVRMVLPREWDVFRGHLPEPDRDGDLAAGYAKLLASPEPAVVDAAARAWCDWEDALIAHETGGARSARYDDPGFRVGFARLVTHYFSHAAWLDEDQLLAGAAEHLAAIPGVLVHGQLDIAGPLDAAWRLHRAWPRSELIIVGAAGHSTSTIGDVAAEATTRFASPGRHR